MLSKNLFIVISIFKNLLLRNKIFFVIDGYRWVVHEIGKEKKKYLGKKFIITSNSRFIKKSIIHFGTLNAFLVSNKKNLKDALLVTGGPKGASKIKDKIFSEYINVSNNVSNVRKFGSAALDMAYVACGRFDGYWQRELNYWDIAAGIVILKEAGGFIDFFEDDPTVPLKKNILASNSNIHEELKELINKKDIE